MGKKKPPAPQPAQDSAPVQNIPAVPQNSPVAPDDTVRLNEAWGGLSLLLLRDVEVSLCRCDARTKHLKGLELAGRENDAQAAARMAFLFVGRVYDFVEKHRPDRIEPQFNQIEAHLKLSGHELRGTRLSKCFKGEVRGKADFGQARQALAYLLLGHALAAESRDWEKEDDLKLRGGTDEEKNRLEVAHRIFRFVFREDVTTTGPEGPRFLLHDRRAHSSPCSATELKTEVERYARKVTYSKGLEKGKWEAFYNFATEAQLVWVLGASPFPRPDLAEQLPDAVAFALAAGVEVTFVYTDAEPEGWLVEERNTLPSESVAEAARIPAADRKKIKRVSIGEGKPWKPGDWAFLQPCNQYIYLKVNSREKDEVLYTLRGYDKAAPPKATYLASHANEVERAAFLRWFEIVRRKAGV